ncbi:hypothetical protein ADT25_15395, partial [Xanthomonas oryzae]
MTFDGTLHRAVWEQAVAAVIARHDALRMLLVEGAPLPNQRVLETLPFALPWHDYSADTDGEQRVHEHIQQAMKRSFAHYGKPLWDIQWLQATATRGYCLYLCHHIVIDGVSLGMLSQQVIDCYNQRLRGEPDQPPAPSYLQALDADLAYIDSTRYQRDLDYWRQALRARPEPLYPSTSAALGRQPVVQRSFTLQPDLLPALTALAERLGGSVTTLIVACVASCLARLNHHHRAPLALGLTVHNRHTRIERDMFGMLSTQLPLYLAVQPHADLAAAMRGVSSALRPAMRHARLHLRHALRELGETGQLAPRPFDISVSVEDFSAFGDVPIEGGVRSMMPLHGDYEDAALGIVVWRYNAACPTTVLFNIDPQRVPLPLAERILAALQHMLLALQEAPHAPLSQLPLLSADQCAQLQGFNASTIDLGDSDCLHHQIQAQAQRTPQAIALVDDALALSYADLDARANQLAHHLIALGVAPDVRVAVCLPRGVDLVVALLAVLKAGGAYVPLDPIYPPARLGFMLRDSAARCLLTHTALTDLLPDNQLARVWIDDTASWAMHPAYPPATQDLSPHHLAYVIYTSGSSGQPKGVMISHHALTQFLAALQIDLPLSPEDRVLAVTTVCFDIAGLELFAPLVHGARVVIAGDQAIQEPADWSQLVDRHAISVLQATPAFWQMLLDTGWQSRPDLRLLCGGEALRPELAQRLRAGGGQLCNLYGPTEATIWTSRHPVLGDEPGSVVPLGRPLANTRLWVLDASHQWVPQGVAGEIYIAGPQLARGYLGRPDLTAERFVPDPFAGQPGQRMYRTGDLARWRADGVLEYLGRNDEQVKIRGFRIELSEIAAALRACAGVRQAAVIAREDTPGNKRLVAYVVGGTDVVPDTEAWRTQLGARLPDYMLPAAYVPLEALPLTANGKLDRRALPAPDADAIAPRGYVAPEGACETELAALWRDLLGVERVGRHDSFFALGGHSLLGVQLIARIRSALGLELPLATLFAQPRLAELAGALVHATPSALPAIVPVERCAPLPLSFAQQRLWVLGQFDTRADLAYLMPGTVTLRGALDVAALRQALNRILARHETLRTRFLATEDGAAQVIDPAETGVALEYIDLRHAADPHAAAQRHAEQESSLALDREQGPLLRARLLQRADDDHLLLVTLHHLVADGWSIGVLLHELGTLYSAFVHGQPDPLPPLPIQYADYALWQRRWIDAARLQQQRQFWLDHLRDAPALLALPTDRPRPPGQDYAGAAIAVAIDAARTRALLALSHRHAATLFMTLLAAWGTLLARLAGQDQVVVGTPVAQRTRTETAALIGLFVNTQALHLDLRADPSVTELLAQVRATALAAQAHQDLPFEQLIEALHPERSLAHAPVFQVMFTWQNTPTVELAMSGLHSEVLPSATHDAKYDLDLDLRLERGCIVGSLRFATALFDTDTVQRQWDSFGVLLDGLLGDQQARVRRLPLLPPAQRQQLHAFHAGDRIGDTSAAAPGNVVQWFAQQAAATPQAIALVCGDATLSYQQLERRSNQLAHRLIALGARPDRCVALCLPRGIAQIIAVLAVLKAGAAYLPLEHSQPDERRARVIADARPVLLLVDSTDRVSAATDLAIPAVSIAAAQAAAADDPAHAPALPPLHPQQLAYVIYTSGSTGQPKGVMVAHHGLGVRLHALIDTYRLGPQDRVLQFATLAFDASVEELFGALCSGAALVLRDDDWLDTERFWSRCAQAGASVVALPTRFWAQLCTAPLDIPACVRQVIVGGEALTAAMRQRWLHGPRIPLLDTYGPTEAIVAATAQAVAADAPNGIGRPLDATRAYVLDRTGELLPIGARGELHLGGAALARGYLGRPGLTAERFVPDPFATQPGERMYRTGDLARWRADGTLDYLGRNDEQVKIRGFRIALGEVAAALRACDGVRQAEVVVREDYGDTRLVAYLVVDHDGAFRAEALRTQLSARLPDYMLPAAYVPLDALPLTANGKLDRRALPAPDADAIATGVYAAPEGEREILLATLWHELLGVERVGRDDNFFALGGHSLLALRLIARLRTLLGLELTLAALFAQPRLADLAQAVARAAASALPAIVPTDRAQPLPLSFAQRRLWFLAQLDDRANQAYAMPGGVELRGALKLLALRKALDRIVARHDALRTTFVANGDSATQVIVTPEVGFALDYSDLRHAHDPDADAQRLAAQEANTPFDLEHGPLIRGRLLRLGEDRHRLLVSMHHLVSDGWSIDVLLRELGALYAAFVQGQPDPLPPLPIQYADYTLWQRRWLDGPRLQRQLEFWRDHLRDAPALLALPTDRPRPALQDYRGDSVDLVLGADLTQPLTALSQRRGTTLFMTVLAAWGTLLARLSSQDQVVIGTPIANRTCSALEPLIGFFVNTQAMRIDLRANPTVADLLAQVRSTVLVAQDHQDLPFEQVIEALNPARDLGHHPIFQAMLVWQNNAEVVLDLPGLQSRVLEQANPTAKFDLQLTLQVQDARIAGQITYATALFERDTIERQRAQFVALLHGLVADDHCRVDRLPLSSAIERQQWLHMLARQHTAFDDTRCLPAVFEQQVARTPQAIALVDGDSALSYAELDARANRLAHHLIAHGVGPEDRVALFLQRDSDLVVAVLAVLKAGAAYLPMDPAYPAERLAFMLDDAQPRALLAHRQLAAMLPTETRMAAVWLDDASVWAQQPAHAPQRSDLRPQHPAYVIYTSGSTGTPKGVVVAHAQVVRLLHATRSHVAPSAEDAWTLFHSCAFDFSVWELWGALAHGGRLVVVPQHIARDPAAFNALLCRHRVSVLNQTPSAFQALIEAQRHRDVQHHLRLVIFGGEALQPTNLAPWFARYGERTALLNMYGITETTVHVSVHAVTAQDVQRSGHSPIGTPLADLRAYVLGPDGQCLPVGVAGELHVAGAGLARGYLGRPGLTAERFVPDPFAERPGERMYKTGDLARWQADGSLAYLGRNDEQVKVRGFRIELGDIAAALRDCDGVRQAAVIAREDSTGDKRLVAYVVGDTNVVLHAEGLRTQLGARLPDYMLPAAYVQLTALPLTANGKLDRRALPAPDADALAARAYVAPEGELETELATLWSALLGVERVGRHDDFFALGGHSLLAVRLISRIRQQLGVDVVLADLFAQPQLAALAARVACSQPSTLPPIVPVPRTQPPPMSFAQQRLWFLSQLDPAAGLAYLIDVGLHLHGALRADVLQQALDRIVARHASLRTRFFNSGDGTPVQHILPAGTVPLPYHDLSHQPDPDAALREHAHEEAAHPFDLTGESLIRGRLLRLAEHHHVLLLTLHHLVADGWSLRILVDELRTLYAAFVQGHADPLAPLTLHYADVAAWQRQWIDADTLQRQRAFWLAHLDGAPAQLSVPTDRQRPAIHDYQGASIQIEIDADLTAALKHLSGRHRTTLFMAVLAAWGVLLARLSHQDQAVIGSPSANRSRSELEPLIGLFVNTQALRIDLRDTPSVAELLAQVRGTVLAAQAHQDLPFEQVIEALNPQRSLAHHPVFQAMLAWQEQWDAPQDLPGLRVRPRDPGESSAKFDLQLTLQTQDARIVGQLTYATALFDRCTIERHLAQFVTLLHGMVANDNTRIDRLPL